MLSASRSGINAVPDSPYAAELQSGRPTMRFKPDLEAEYLRAHLLHSRALVRVACIISVVIAIFRVTEQSFHGSWENVSLMTLALVVSGSIMLGAIAWSATYEKLFLPWAQVIVPVRNAIVAAHIGAAAATGQVEMLMMLPILLIGPFFFMALRFRMALFSGIVTVVAFSTFAIYLELQTPIAVRACVILILGLIACAIAARHLEQWSRTSFLEKHLIVELAQHDALTGTKNRRVFDEHLANLWPRAIHDRRNVAILLLDVDYFKAYNDHYGHQAGDIALRRVAQTVKTFVRSPLDVLARYGGEEFAAVLYDVNADHATAIADRMRQAVQELNIEHTASRTCPSVTISIGVAVIEPTLKRNAQGALQLADQALYTAKVKGRNRVELMNETEYRMLVTGIFSRTSPDMHATTSIAVNAG